MFVYSMAFSRILALPTLVSLVVDGCLAYDAEPVIYCLRQGRRQLFLKGGHFENFSISPPPLGENFPSFALRMWANGRKFARLRQF